MSNPVTLLVASDIAQARLIGQAIEGRALPDPVHVLSGEEAVLWVGAHRCDVCVLDYHLLGIDGLETLVRIHRQQPNLPVVMLLGAEAEEMVVAAFHAGAVDYVPKTPGFPDVVAQRVQQVMRPSPAPPLVSPVAQVAGVEQLLCPTYQNRLRVIGRQLDRYEYRSVNLLEVGGGILVRALKPGSRTPKTLEFPDHDFAPLITAAIGARGEGERRRSKTALLPTGYEDFLRALGRWLDGRLAEAITVSELDSFVAVGGVAKVDGPAQMAVAPFQTLLRADDIAALLDRAFRRRGTAES